MLSKQNLILISLLLVFAAATAYLYNNHDIESTKLVKADRGFAVENMDHITKVVIKQPKMPPITFNRNRDTWMINDKYRADQAVMVHIEKVLTNIRLLYVPPTKTAPTILKSITANGIQVDVYQNDKPHPKIIHIGSDTQNGDGTYMVLGGTTEPYAMHLPGLSGGIRSRFEQPIENYRDKFIIQAPLDDLLSLKLEYPQANEHSFFIQSSNQGFKISPLIERRNVNTNFNSHRVIAYLESYRSLGAEKLMNHYPEKDKIMQGKPCVAIKLVHKTGTSNQYSFYPYDVDQTLVPVNSPGEIRHQNRLYVLVDSTDFYVVQNRVFSKIFQSIDAFVENDVK